jgi:hypothetical protein
MNYRDWEEEIQASKPWRGVYIPLTWLVRILIKQLEKLHVELVKRKTR